MCSTVHNRWPILWNLREEYGFREASSNIVCNLYCWRDHRIRLSWNRRCLWPAAAVVCPQKVLLGRYLQDSNCPPGLWGWCAEILQLFSCILCLPDTESESNYLSWNAKTSVGFSWKLKIKGGRFQASLINFPQQRTDTKNLPKPNIPFRTWSYPATYLTPWIVLYFAYPKKKCLVVRQIPYISIYWPEFIECTPFYLNCILLNH